MTSVVLRGKENGCLLSKGTCATVRLSPPPSRSRRCPPPANPLTPRTPPPAPQVGTWKIPNVRFAKTVNLLGARGFPVTLQERHMHPYCTAYRQRLPRHAAGEYHTS